MQGVDPYGYMRQVAEELDRLDTRAELETVLDEVEYLFEVLDPELQDFAYELIDRIQAKLNRLS
jgi:ribosome assembly protein YihI (activator of Der GTPase)